MKKVIAYVHSHWDREWYREFEEFRLRLIEVFDEIIIALKKGDLPVFYFDGQTDSTIKNDQGWYLTVRCSFKNYDDEIELFLDWLAPYIETYGFLGYHRYEEFDDPTLIYKEDGKIVYKNITNTLTHA